MFFLSTLKTNPKSSAAKRFWRRRELMKRHRDCETEASRLAKLSAILRFEATSNHRRSLRCHLSDNVLYPECRIDTSRTRSATECVIFHKALTVCRETKLCKLRRGFPYGLVAFSREKTCDLLEYRLANRIVWLPPAFQDVE